jgi:signal transduction histidine kinase
MPSRFGQKIDSLYEILNNPSFDIIKDRNEILTALQELEEIDQEREILIRRISQTREHQYLQAISRIHDGPLQTLPATAMTCKLVIDSSNDINVIRTSVLSLIAQIDESIKDIRSVLLEKGNESETETDLITMLQSAIRKSNIPVTLNIPNSGQLHQVQSGIASIIVRFVQEARINAENHGKATDVIVSILQEASHLKIQVEDNGYGFRGSVPKNLEDLQDFADRGHIGLRLIAGIARKYNGALSFTPKGPVLGGAVVQLEVTLP